MLSVSGQSCHYSRVGQTNRKPAQREDHSTRLYNKGSVLANYWFPRTNSTAAHIKPTIIGRIGQLPCAYSASVYLSFCVISNGNDSFLIPLSVWSPIEDSMSEADIAFFHGGLFIVPVEALSPLLAI